MPDRSPPFAPSAADFRILTDFNVSPNASAGGSRNDNARTNRKSVRRIGMEISVFHLRQIRRRIDEHIISRQSEAPLPLIDIGPTRCRGRPVETQRTLAFKWCRPRTRHLCGSPEGARRIRRKPRIRHNRNLPLRIGFLDDDRVVSECHPALATRVSRNQKVITPHRRPPDRHRNRDSFPRTAIIPTGARRHAQGKQCCQYHHFLSLSPCSLDR